ncbi:enoyl-CoA hydratase/carnithine racemase [Methylobacterium brachiatum]|uniref:Enoyl-CoA hydratase/carnithine racemase n=1 Tax=Methylobacterium brachiatum TaxID=269660 RepID=A0AAJ1TT17_9HYPH|nr:enoyl-CoA hydratase-related protein [Methylobacterium brachiatum]MCB4806175.1 enoyl-CoA hydratase/isomerase family protein [Methylobacterium brachiatum]MDQ0546631.1 enoyl-CoA hydratase/carnithine racemase [Methylobacterium brachiatum]
MTGQILEETSGSCATLTISQPARRNALTVLMWQDLAKRVRALSRDDGMRCIVIRGATPEAFSAGADISEFHATRATHAQVVRFHEEYVGGCLEAIATCPVPIVAAIRGSCFGGGLEIAVACDIRIAAADARFGAPVGRMGFPMALGETEGLFKLVGPAVTAELLIEGRLFDAQTAHEKGLVSRVVQTEAFERATIETVENICASGIRAARSHKQQIRRLMQDATAVTRAERMEVYSFADSEEYKRGVEAFLTKARRRR